MAAILAYKKSKLLFEERPKGTTEIKIEKFSRIVIALIFFTIPIAINGFFGVAIAIIAAIGEIIFIFLAEYVDKLRKQRKAIKV